jgi:hypothetical protein
MFRRKHKEIKMEDFINRRFGHWVVKGIAPSLESPCGTKRRAFYC